MKRSKLIEILEDKLSNTNIIISKESGKTSFASKTIYFKNKLTGVGTYLKCYSYHDKLDLESDECIWYFFIYEGTGDYQEYMIPNSDSEVYIEVVIERYLDYQEKKIELDNSLDKLKTLRKKNIQHEIRDFKLNKILNE